MSMVQLTIVQFLLAFFIYTGLTLALPAIILYPKVAHCRVVTRFFVYFTVGNFYLMNLVYVLELLHISCWLTLVAGTVIPAGVLLVKIREIPVRTHLKSSNERIDRVIRGSFGVKNWLRRLFRALFDSIGTGVRAACRTLVSHWSDALMTAVVIAGILISYGWSLTQNFGYCTSDISVHNYWINYLGKNKIFVAGVYPFGFHNIIYYIHAVFRIDTYVLLRVFWLVQTLWIHLVLLMFLKGVSRSRFLPYTGTLVYVFADFHINSYQRYFSSLPQEFGMLFILPAVYFAFAFFRIKKEELKGRRTHMVSKWYLVGFALNFAMTLSVHFYGTIILGFFCVGIASGYLWRFLQPKYFIKIVKTCFLGLFIAMLPMVLAYMMGTQLEGSLRWAMSVMGPQEDEARTDEKEVDEEGIPLTAHLVELEDGSLAYEDILEDGTTVYYTLEGELTSADGTGGTGIRNEAGDETEEEQEVYVPTMEERLQDIQEKLLDVYETVDTTVQICLFWKSGQPLRYLIYLALAVVCPLALLLLLLRRPDEAFSLVSAGVNVAILLLMLAAPDLGLPTVMQQSRISIYLNYMLPVLWVMIADRVLYVLFGIWRAKWMRHLMNTASLAVAVAGCVLLVQTGCVREREEFSPYQSNEAVTCLTNIIREEEDFSWTIVSAYDEMRMGEDHGYHEELNTFLRNMEYTGGTSMITLPSKNLFFFVEKRPLDYSAPYEGSGQLVSEEGASHALPPGVSFENYKGENRWIMMSRFYEWAKMFQKMHPHEMKVYFENDNFVCYKLTQNDYHLYNLSIDYGYNNVY